MRRLRIGVDIGGTFTDIVILVDDGTILTKKVSSSVEDYARAIVEGLTRMLQDAGFEPAWITEIMHGTTVASNAILERRGARVGLIGTRGFRDILEIRNLRMPRLYDLRFEKPPPLVERQRRVTVAERVNARGEVVEPLARMDAIRAVERLLELDVESIAVCLINAYANPIHERMLAETIVARAPGLHHCISYDVLPEIKEYERTSTTVINAYVLPIVRGYIDSLGRHLERSGTRAPLLLMQSNGGLTPGEEASRRPVNIVESGPAAGVVGGQAIARKCGFEDVITFDMGGTTAKASLIEGGRYTRARESAVGGGIMAGSRLLTGGGYLLSVSAIDLAEVGAGGGSIVWIDAGDVMQVGPRSAGASPGPVCYDRGGEAPTITDANVILGCLSPEHLCGGEIPLNPDKAHTVFESKIARPLGLDLAYAAYGARRVAISSMIRAIRAVSSERGRDPREYVLLAFGGNGPLFAADMAGELGMKKIIIPPASGLFSALGLLHAEVEHHYSRTVRALLADADPERVEAAYRELEDGAVAQLRADGFDRAHCELRRGASLHYKGQIYELDVAVAPGRIDSGRLRALQESFGLEHARTYGHRAGADEPVELVNVQLVGRGVGDGPRFPEEWRLEAGPEAPSIGSERRVYFGPGAGWIVTPVVARRHLRGGCPGPLIVEEYDATCLVTPGAAATLDGGGNIVIDLVR